MLVLVILAVIVIAMVAIIWLVVQAINLVWRAFAANPRSRELWTALLIWIGAALGVLGLVGGASAGWVTPDQARFAAWVLQPLWWLATAALLIVARRVEVGAQVMFAAEPVSITTALRRPWWHTHDDITS